MLLELMIWRKKHEVLMNKRTELKKSAPSLCWAGLLLRFMGRILPELRRILAAAILAATVAVGGEKGRQSSVLVKAIE